MKARGHPSLPKQLRQGLWAGWGPSREQPQWHLSYFSFGCIVKNSPSSMSPLSWRGISSSKMERARFYSLLLLLFVKRMSFLTPFLNVSHFQFGSPLNPSINQVFNQGHKIGVFFSCFLAALACCLLAGIQPGQPDPAIPSCLFWSSKV